MGVDEGEDREEAIKTGSQLEESTYLTSGSTTKPELSRQYGTGTKIEI